MNIKYIANTRVPTPRAHGYAIMKMCEQLSILGADVKLVIPNKKNNEEEENPFLYYGIKPVFEIIKIDSVDLLGSSIKFGKLFYWIDLFSFVKNLIFRRIVKQSDVVYTRDFIIPLLFSKKRNVYLELHDIPQSNFLFKIAIKIPKLFFVLNKNIKLELVKMGVKEEMIYIFPSGVEVKEFDIQISQKEAREKLGLSIDKKIVLYSGQFYSWKGLDTLAEAAKLLPDYKFVFIGGTEPELSRFKSEYGSLENVVVEPFKERSIIPLYLKSADVLVIPQSAKEKISTHYSSPLKMLEYMASRRPIVASNLSSIRETLDEDSAVFAQSENPQSFAEAIKKVLSSEGLATRIAENAYNKVLQCSWDKRAKSILNIIEKYGETLK